MLVGYYDAVLYSDLIEGVPYDQNANPNINETIASSGDGQYTGGGGVIVAGTPGTGHIPDYALYDGYNDYYDPGPYLDMSDINPAGAHADDCIADFLLTGRSSESLTMGATFSSDIELGIEDFFTYMTYAATATPHDWGAFTWGQFKDEIDSDRPVVVGVDADGDGLADHAVLAVGYDDTTNKYKVHTTWADVILTPEDESQGWFDFGPVGAEYGISDVVFVTVI
jgi:hypothetical protein